MSGEVVFAWPIDSHYGWGIRGLNFALGWDGMAVSAMPQGRAELPPDDPRQALLAERLELSRRFCTRVLLDEGEAPATPVLVALGNDLRPQPCAFGRYVRGRPTIACPVFEDVETVKRNIDRLNEYDAVIVASSWNRDVLDDLGIKAVVCHEGIDPTIFNPSVRRKRDDGRFRVFSGGKAEYRKGQDIVVEAFKLFAEKHDDAVLVAAWGSPWGGAGQDFEGKWAYGAPPGSHIGRPNFHAWVERAGLKPHQFEYVEPRANWRMAEVYASCDVAVFPNRREGGTNFVAMECMACGVPTVLSACDGHNDLIGSKITGFGSILRNQTLIVEQLEMVLSALYGESSPLPVAGMEYWAWDRHCREMAEIIAGA